MHGHDQKGEQNHTTKNFVGFHNHSPQLTLGIFFNEEAYRLKGRTLLPEKNDTLPESVSLVKLLSVLKS